MGVLVVFAGLTLVSLTIGGFPYREQCFFEAAFVYDVAH